MNVEIKNIRDEGQLDRERLVLRVLGDDDIGHYAVLMCRVGSTSTSALSGLVPKAYWFPDDDVFKGDLVILYTKKGTRGRKENTDGTTSHFFYWGLDNPAWDSRIAVLLSAPRWQVWED